MISIMNKSLPEMETCLDSQFWHACAGAMVQMPTVNSKVFYFPQGHAEHAKERINFQNFPFVPPLILCKISNIKFLADVDTDEVYVKIRLVPLQKHESEFDDRDCGFDNSESQDLKPASFAKTLTQSDANNGGGFSVPRYCAETIFPRLDYSANPPVQALVVKDVHGVIWKFRHIYRGTPRRHLLTTGWSNFVNQKKLIAGDSIVFFRAENGDLCVGIQRAKRGFTSGSEPSYFLSEKSDTWGGKERVNVESVFEAASLAAKGEPFEVVYYPRASSPEFCVKASSVYSALRTQWCIGMRFKMPFETEDSSRISWFMGTISSVQVHDPIHWPNSPWRILQVAWDEPELLQNVRRVSPWLVELVSSVPTISLPPLFSPPRKKMRIPQPSDFPFVGQFPMATYPSNPLKPNSSSLCCVRENNGNSNTYPAGIQGARHAHFGLPMSDRHLSKLPNFSLPSNGEGVGNLSQFLSLGTSTQGLNKNSLSQKPKFLLFGQPIFSEDQISKSSSFNGSFDKIQNQSDGSGSTVVQNSPLEITSYYGKSEFGLETVSF